MAIKKVLSLLILVCFFTKANAQIKINEYSVSNTTKFTGTTYLDNQGNYPDWIELYNPSTSSVSISNLYLSNNRNDLTLFQLPATASITANGFLRIWCSGKGAGASNATNIHTNFELTQCIGDSIFLSNGTTIIDTVGLALTQSNHSRGRLPDGASTWKLFATPTPTATNAGQTAYIDYVATPVMGPAAGFLTGANSISLSCPTPSVTKIFYSLNGSEPTVASPQYTAALTLTTTTVVRAMATTTIMGYLPSFFETNTYFINENINSNFGVVSVSGASTLKGMLNATSASTTSLATHFEYFENGQLKTETYGFATKNTPDITSPSPIIQHGIDYETADDYGYNNAIKHQFFSDTKQGTSSRIDFEHLLLKAAGDDNYPNDTTSINNKRDTIHTNIRDVFAQTFALSNNLHIDGRRNKYTVLFVNGKYNGIYDLREAVDADYLKYYYNVNTDSIDNISTINNALVANNGSSADWTSLYNYIKTKSMTNVTFYTYVENRLDFSSLIDYMIYNSYMVNADFITNNVALWKTSNKLGTQTKWKFAMVNMDNVYDIQTPSPSITTSVTTDPCAYQTNYGDTSNTSTTGYAAIVTRLMTNPKFRDLYVNRFSELLKTTLNCTKLNAYLTYLETLIKPEMTRHIDSLGGSLASIQQWQKNIDTLHSRISERCKNIESKMLNCYNVSGPYNLHITVDPPECVAEVTVDSLKSQSFAWDVSYFGNVNVKLKQRLIDTANYEFSHWEFAHHITNPLKPKDSLSILLISNDDIIVHYSPKIIEAAFPSGFSPNGDGQNDFLNIVGTKNVKNYTVEIWNRWGQLVFSSNDIKNGWDGNYKGSPSPTGVYAFVVKYTDGLDVDQLKKGNVTLIR